MSRSEPAVGLLLAENSPAAALQQQPLTMKYAGSLGGAPAASCCLPSLLLSGLAACLLLKAVLGPALLLLGVTFLP
jgi:hypothetical protein